MIRTQVPFIDMVRRTDLEVVDCDGTFYEYPEEFDDHCDIEGAKAALTLIKKQNPDEELTFDEALKIKKVIA